LGRPEQSAAFQRRFVADVHRLVAQGFLGLPREDLSEKDEPTITGFLVEAIRNVLDDHESPRWVERYAVQEERPVEGAAAAEGARRPRVDIEFESNRSRPRPRFQLEAKRLRTSDSKSVANYLGENGLGCFLEGRYASDHDQAGLLGYVQAGELSMWAQRIQTRLAKSRRQYRLAEDCTGLVQNPQTGELEHCYRSVHTRTVVQVPIAIHHIFLDCREA
jgi:hypothetical protein